MRRSGFLWRIAVPKILNGVKRKERGIGFQNPGKLQRVALAQIVGFVYTFWMFLLQFSSIPGCTAAIVLPTSQWNCQENL